MLFTYALRAIERGALRATFRADLRDTLRVLARTSLVEADEATGVLATMAFLVVFKVLIRDFFSIVTGALLRFEISFRLLALSISTGYAKPGGRGRLSRNPIKYNGLPSKATSTPKSVTGGQFYFRLIINHR